VASLEDMTVDQLLAEAKRLQRIEATVNQVMAHPEGRETILRTVKKLNPSANIPEIDQADRVEKAIATEREEREKLERKLMERDARDAVAQRRADIKTKYRLSDTDVEEVEKLMLDPANQVGSHDAAARLYLYSKQSATPTPASSAPPTFSMPETDVWGKGVGNKNMLDKIAMNEAFAAWNEVMGGKVQGLGPARTN